MAIHPVYLIKNSKTKVIHAYKRKLDATYHHASMRYRPYLRFMELKSQHALSGFKGYKIKGDCDE